MQFPNTTENSIWSYQINRLVTSSDKLLQQRPARLVQEKKSSEGQVCKKTASLRVIQKDVSKDENQQNTITIISNVHARDRDYQGESSQFSISESFVPLQAAPSLIKFESNSKGNQKERSKYRLISQNLYKNLNCIQQNNQTQSSNSSTYSSILQTSSLPFEKELELIESNQQRFSYLAFQSKPLYFHLSNLTEEEQIGYLLTKNLLKPGIDLKKAAFQYNNHIAESRQSNQQSSKLQKCISTCLDLSQKNTINIPNTTLKQKNTLNENFIKLSRKKNNSIILMPQQQISSCQSFSKTSYKSSNIIYECNSKHTDEIITVVEQFFQSQSKIKSEVIFHWIEDQIKNQKPYDNYIHKFIYHKKYKDFETEEQKYQGVSRFHNLNRMFMHNIIKILVKENLQKFNIPLSILNKITFIIASIKNEAFKKYNNGKSKTCFFNHYHYNILFLQINSKTLKLFSRNSKDLELHKSIFKVSLDGETLSSMDIHYCNLIKHYIYRIVEATIQQNISSQDYHNCVRLQYVERVLNGIQKLSEGHPIKRF